MKHTYTFSLRSFSLSEKRLLAFDEAAQPEQPETDEASAESGEEQPESTEQPPETDEDVQKEAEQRQEQAEKDVAKVEGDLTDADNKAAEAEVQDTVEEPSMQEALQNAKVSPENTEKMIAAVAHLPEAEQRELLVEGARLMRRLGINGLQKIVKFYTADSDEVRHEALSSFSSSEMQALHNFQDLAAFQKMEAFAKAQKEGVGEDLEGGSGNALRSGLDKLAEMLGPFLEMLSEFMAEFNQFFKKVQDAMQGKYNPNALPENAADIDAEVARGEHLPEHRAKTEADLKDKEEKIEKFEGKNDAEKEKKAQEKIDGIQTTVDELNKRLDGKLSPEERTADQAQLERLEKKMAEAKTAKKQLEGLIKDRDQLQKRLKTIDEKIGAQKQEKDAVEQPEVEQKPAAEKTEEPAEPEAGEQEDAQAKPEVQGASEEGDEPDKDSSAIG